ncbi:hypothetical protein H920_11976 [Fukomys damarensis]|uniref:Secreted protein n=1 Tax=Fukomys damarensis TaxID=885580 RepID=A0A091D676_FUKDA|nr:hypothetical protein H920_11976 [Fukomys damarensis]
MAAETAAHPGAALCSVAAALLSAQWTLGLPTPTRCDSRKAPSGFVQPSFLTGEIRLILPPVPPRLHSFPWLVPAAAPLHPEGGQPPEHPS